MRWPKWPIDYWRTPKGKVKVLEVAPWTVNIILLRTNINHNIIIGTIWNIILRGSLKYYINNYTPFVTVKSRNPEKKLQPVGIILY